MKNLIIIIIGLTSNIAYAGNFACVGKVELIALGPSSSLLQVNTGFGTHYLCKFSESYNGVHPETCKAWYSMFLSAQASGREITQNYNDANGTNCDTLGNWSVPNPMPYFVKIKN